MTDGSGKKILIVDDDPVGRDIVSLHLAAAGYEPLLADNGVQALALMRRHRPRIVISDWLMPQMNGLEVCKQIRAAEKDCLVYFIMLTVQSDKDRLLEAFDAGVDDFLSKPFHHGELLARVRAGVRMVGVNDMLAERTAALERSNTQLSHLNERLRELASVDDVTGLLNRRQAVTRLQELFALAKRYAQPLACAVIDIDRFKSINDRFGHLQGDAVLRALARTLAESVRTTDLVFRIGGEEFMVLFPQQSAADAAICAERCRARVAAAVFAPLPPDEHLTISIGVAQYDEAMSTPEDLLRAADTAMYQAKAQGRNQTILDGAHVLAAPPA